MKMIMTGALLFFVGTFRWITVPESGQKLPDPSQFSILDVTIGQDNLATLQGKLGAVKKCHTNEHDGVDVAGYTDSKESVVFEFGEVGGGDVTGFYLSRPRRTPGCPLSQLSSKISGLATKGGIHLGMTEGDFASIFGPPKSRTDNLWKYDWTFDAKYTEEEKRKAAKAGEKIADAYSVGITIEARFSGGVLRYFYISKVEVT
jgi:hypothetical protein